MPLSFRPAPTGPIPLNVFLYGPPKSGKTRAAATAPGPILYVNADLPNATRSIHDAYGEKIMEVEWSGLQTLMDVSNAAKAESAKPYEDRKFRTIVIDPLGELYRRLLEDTTNRSMRPQLQQRGDVTTHLERFLRFLCALDLTVVLIAHEQVVEGAEDQPTEWLPMTGTKNTALGHKIMGMVDVIGYTGITETEDGERMYVAQLALGKGRRGGDRFDNLGPWRTMDLTEWVALSQGQTPNTPEGATPSIESGATSEKEEK